MYKDFLWVIFFDSERNIKRTIYAPRFFLKSIPKYNIYRKVKKMAAVSYIKYDFGTTPNRPTFETEDIRIEPLGLILKDADEDSFMVYKDIDRTDKSENMITKRSGFTYDVDTDKIYRKIGREIVALNGGRPFRSDQMLTLLNGNILNY